MKKFLCYFLSILVLFSTLIINCSTKVYAADSDDNYTICNASYVRNKGSYEITIQFKGIDFKNQKFKGTFNVSGSKTFSDEIDGIFSNGTILENYYIKFNVDWGNSEYILNINDDDGTLYGTTTCKFESLTGKLDCNFKGTKNAITKSDIISTIKINNDLYEECKNLSLAAYKGKLINQMPSKLKDELEKNSYKDLKCYNFNDNDDTNVSYVLGHKKLSNGEEKCIVIIRGTDGVEWEGNMKICPPDKNNKTDSYTFTSVCDKTHYNFLQATNNLKENLLKYINGELNSYNINNSNTTIVISGHSRGGAVANLLAKDITNNSMFNTKTTAYTFATPNVALYTDNPNMEFYTNIFNFCNFSDFIPYIPIIGNEWNYWKFGKTYITSYNNSDIKDGKFYCTELTKIMKSQSLAPTVEEYYNRKFKNENNDSVSLYDFMIECLAKPMANKVTMIDGGIKTLYKIQSFDKYKGLSKLVKCFSANIIKIGLNHSTSTYNSLKLNDYYRLKYNDVILFLEENNNDTEAVNQARIMNDENILDFNELELTHIKEFLKTCDTYNISNAEKLNYIIDDPLTWNGIEFNENNRIVKINLNFQNLYGKINLNGFSELTDINLNSNYISSIELNNCKNLKRIDISDNNLSSINLKDCTSIQTLDISSNNISNIDLLNNNQLLDLTLYNCNINNLDISTLNNLESINCSFNNLSTLDISNNKNLKIVYCFMNRLDLNDNNLINNLNSIKEKENSQVINLPQLLQNNVQFNSNELQALETFAKVNNNNEALNWLNDNGDIDINKVQNNVYFEFDGEKYKIKAIDISNIDVQGDLDLSSFTELTSLYCDNTKITGLNVSNSKKLEDLVCENSEITSLILPVNSTQNSSKLSNIKCQNNHIDINIFTDEIIKNIESKDNYILEYKHQIIEKDISAFDESDYNLLVNFANQRNNNKIIDWDLSTPGKWENVSWKFDNTSGKYKLLECHFDFMEVKGNIDVSGCDMLDEVSFSGSKINTVTISGKNLNDSTFYDCSELEAVIIKGGSAIYKGTFKMCPTLQAIYIPSDITEIADNAFENSSNITIAGVADSYAQTYANEHNINFKPGTFICGNIVAKENLDDSYQYYYPVEDVSIVYKNEVQSTSDKLGYFVLFSTESGENQYKLEYPYGYNINQTTSITNNEPLIIENPIGLICYDWINDGYINAKDYLKLSDQIKKGSEITGIDDKYFDINKDGKVTEDDWKFANNFLLYSNPNK